MSPVMRLFVCSFLLCHAVDDEAMSLLQTRAGEISDTNLSEFGPEPNFDRTLAAKGTPEAPPPTPAPTEPPCNGIQLNQYNSEKFVVSQISTYHGKATYTYEIELGGKIWQKTSDAGTYFLGHHSSYGTMVEYFRNGAKCGHTPRMADVHYTVGHNLKLLSAEETSMCVYNFVIQVPESFCNLPITDLSDLDTNNEDGENEHQDEIIAEENAQHDCRKWCYSKKHNTKPWKMFGDNGQENKPFKCGWNECAKCEECKPF